MWWAAEQVEPDAGWSRLVALAVAVGIFYGAIQFRDHVWKPFRRSLNPSRKDPQTLPALVAASKSGRGHLYVIIFSTGIAKVGKTGNPAKRLDQHARDAAAFGATIVDRWVSPAHADYDTTEDTLIVRCAREATQIKREYFSGLTMDRAREIAEAVIAEREGVREGPTEEVEGVPGGQVPARLVGWLARRLGATAAQPHDHVPPGPAIDVMPAAAGVEQPPSRPAWMAGKAHTTQPAAVAVVTAAPGEHGPAIQQVLDVNGIDARVVRFAPGPVVSRYEVALQPTVGVEQLRRIASRIASACKVAAVDVALVAGRGTVGVDVPNVTRGQVLLGDVLAEAGPDPMTLGLGRSIDGVVAPSLRRLPHLLIGGASGTGKSTLINACVCSLLRGSADEVGLVLIDPYEVELAAYARVPQLAAPMVTDARQAAEALLWVGHEMQRRSALFVEAGVKDIDGYSQARADGSIAGPALSYLVVVVDELAAVMTVARDDVEDPIVAIAESGRKYGAHMILATQSPRADVVTGRIKANVPGRLALTTTSQLESRIILDRGGAEQLTGDGDALFVAPGAALTRVQCSLIDADGIVAAVARASMASDLGQLREAARLVVATGQASTSMLQSRMRLGWPAARRLLADLEARGLVGPADGNKARPVLVQADRLDEMMRGWR